MLRAAFKLALRQAEGLMASVVELLGCELAVPDHTTVSRRSTIGPTVFGAGQWLSAGSGHIVAVT